MRILFSLILMLGCLEANAGWLRNKVFIDIDGDGTAEEMKISDKALVAFIEAEKSETLASKIAAEKDKQREADKFKPHKCGNLPNLQGVADTAALAIAEGYKTCMMSIAFGGGGGDVAGIVRAARDQSDDPIVQMARSDNQLASNRDSNETKVKIANRQLFGTILNGFIQLYAIDKQSGGSGGQSIGDGNVFNLSNSGDTSNAVASAAGAAGEEGAIPGSGTLNNDGTHLRQITIFGNNDQAFVARGNTRVGASTTGSNLINGESATLNAVDGEQKSSLIGENVDAGGFSTSDNDGLNDLL